MFGVLIYCWGVGFKYVSRNLDISNYSLILNPNANLLHVDLAEQRLWSCLTELESKVTADHGGRPAWAPGGRARPTTVLVGRKLWP